MKGPADLVDIDRSLLIGFCILRVLTMNIKNTATRMMMIRRPPTRKNNIHFNVLALYIFNIMNYTGEQTRVALILHSRAKVPSE